MVVAGLAGCQSCDSIYCKNMSRLSGLVNAAVDECCRKPEADQAACLQTVQSLVTTTIGELNASASACENDNKKRVDELWDDIIKQWTNPSIIVRNQGIVYNTWPLLTPDETLDFDIICTKALPCKTVTTMNVGAKQVLPEAAGKEAVATSESSASAFVPTLVNSETASYASEACVYNLPDGAAIQFQTAGGPLIDLPVTGHFTLVNLTTDQNGRSALIGESVLKIETPAKGVTLEAVLTEPDAKLSVDASGSGTLQVAMSVRSERIIMPGMNGQVFWFKWPVTVSQDGAELRLRSGGPIEGQHLVPISASTKAGLVRAGVTYPRLPGPETDACGTGLGNPDMRDRADWIMQGFYGSIFGLCSSPYVQY